MVGRNEDRPVGTHGVGTARNGELRKIVEEAVERAGVNAKLHAWGDIRKEDSDHYPFFKKEVPVMFFFTDLHADYHTASDTPEKLAYPNMAKIGRATFLIAAESADRKERFLWNPPRTLGIRAGGGLSDADAEKAKLADGDGGLLVDGVSSKSVAEAAGLRRGDAILEFNGTKMPRHDPLAALESALEMVEENKPVKILVLRKGQRVDLKAAWK
jgi:membrane-associated protease RseP (regulator of RpoE activity)